MEAVVVQNVVKEFTLRHTRSLKELAVWTVRGRDHTNQFRALDDVSVTIEQGETIALLGWNGSGKSTLLKLMSGVMSPDSGRVRVRGRIAGLIEVGAGLHPDLTGRENVYLNGAILGMSERRITDLYDRIVAFSEIEQFIDTEVKFYSSGMFLRLAFAVAVHTQPDVFLVDEILAVGDEPFQQKCLRRIGEMSDDGTTLVIVTHDLDVVAKLCARGVVLDRGRVAFDGPADAAVGWLRSV